MEGVETRNFHTFTETSQLGSHLGVLIEFFVLNTSAGHKSVRMKRMRIFIRSEKEHFHGSPLLGTSTHFQHMSRLMGKENMPRQNPSVSEKQVKELRVLSLRIFTEGIQFLFGDISRPLALGHTEPTRQLNLGPWKSPRYSCRDSD